MAIQEVEPDVFYRKCSSLCAVLLASPLGLAYQNPIRSPITGSRKTAPINETLQQQRPYPVPGLPILWQLPGGLRKQSRSQIPALDPRKDQKPGLPHDASQSRFTLLVVPVNPAIPRLQPPGAHSRTKPPVARRHTQSIAVEHPATAYSPDNDNGRCTRSTDASRMP